MSIEFKKVSNFQRGILYELLKDAYSFDCRYEHKCNTDWRIFDDFFFDNLQIADKCGFITTHDDIKVMVMVESSFKKQSIELRKMMLEKSL